MVKNVTLLGQKGFLYMKKSAGHLLLYRPLASFNIGIDAFVFLSFGRYNQFHELFNLLHASMRLQVSEGGWRQVLVVL